MADIRSALARLIQIQAAVEISDPDGVTVQRAWKYVPPQNTTVPETPCFMNDYTLRGEQRNPSQRVSMWTIRSQIYVQNADLDEAADIATALFEQYRRDLGKDTNLSGNISGAAPIRGADPTLGGIPGREGYMIVECFMDFEIKEAFDWQTRRR